MARRSASSQTEHDRVVEAWARFLSGELAEGLQVSTNPGSAHAVRVGPDDVPRYPDVVAWQAQSADGRRGAAEIISEVETADSLNEEELKEWDAYGSLPTPFYLIVPAGNEGETIRLLKKNRIRVSQLWSFRSEGGEIRFSHYMNLPGI